MRLLSMDRFALIFDGLREKRVGVVDGFGNPGDRLLDAAARQLLDAFGIRHVTVNPFADAPGTYPADVLLLAGGGSMGGPRQCVLIRQRALEHGLPCIVLPQSFHAPEECAAYEKVYVRERASLNLWPPGILGPDLALGYDFPAMPAPRFDRGVFLRADGHAMFADRGAVDPAAFCYTPQDYFAFVAAYRHIVTDRLHLAIVALGLGRKATLLPVAYHKNRSMWETWLKDLGCTWSDRPS
ncbi:MAG: polysaccharide pyruvyl transferase family protein [Pirellulales bacterium]|nr:polysaccharide pyruvyl transferase family protein [Pirellulales bacterium]